MRRLSGLVLSGLVVLGGIDPAKSQEPILPGQETTPPPPLPTPPTVYVPPDTDDIFWSDSSYYPKSSRCRDNKVLVGLDVSYSDKAITALSIVCVERNRGTRESKVVDKGIFSSTDSSVSLVSWTSGIGNILVRRNGKVIVGVGFIDGEEFRGVDAERGGETSDTSGYKTYDEPDHYRFVGIQGASDQLTTQVQALKMMYQPRAPSNGSLETIKIDTAHDTQQWPAVEVLGNSFGMPSACPIVDEDGDKLEMPTDIKVAFGKRGQLTSFSILCGDGTSTIARTPNTEISKEGSLKCSLRIRSLQFYVKDDLIVGVSCNEGDVVGEAPSDADLKIADMAAIFGTSYDYHDGAITSIGVLGIKPPSEC